MDVRSATERDRDAVLALGVAEEAAWFGCAELSLEEIGEWIDEEGGLTPGLVTVDSGGAVCGFASPGRHAAVFVADPVRSAAVADELLPWLCRQGAVVALMTFAGDLARMIAFERHGLRQASVPGHGERDREAWLDKERRCRSMFVACRGGRPVGWVAGRVLDGRRGGSTPQPDFEVGHEVLSKPRPRTFGNCARLPQNTSGAGGIGPRSACSRCDGG